MLTPFFSIFIPVESLVDSLIIFGMHSFVACGICLLVVAALYRASSPISMQRYLLVMGSTVAVVLGSTLTLMPTDTFNTITEIHIAATKNLVALIGVLVLIFSSALLSATVSSILSIEQHHDRLTQQMILWLIIGSVIVIVIGAIMWSINNDGSIERIGFVLVVISAVFLGSGVQMRWDDRQ